MHREFIIFTGVVVISLFMTIHSKNKKAIQSNLIDIVFLSLSGVFLYNILFFKGLQTVHAAKAAVIIAFNPSITILISSFLFKEKMTLKRALGVILALAGAYVVISDGENLSFKSIGEGDITTEMTPPDEWGGIPNQIL